MRQLDRFQKTVLLAISLIAFVAIFDNFQYPKSFWAYSLLLGAIVAGSYYFFRRDLSEAFAIFIAFYLMLVFGLEDLIFYIIQGGIPSSMDHLFTHQVIGKVAKIMGLTTVTPSSLIISVIVGGILTYFIVNYLRKKW